MKNRNKMILLTMTVEKSDEMRCDSNSEVRLDRMKFYEHSLEMLKKP